MAELNIVLHEPEIPANTGNIGRTCVATGTKLHLIEPLGFSLSEKHLKRAGMDYWKDLDVTVYENWEDFCKRIPEEILKANPDTCVRIPMIGETRSLNLSNSVAIVLYEALRQNDFDHMKLEGQLHRLSWDD